MQALAVKNMLSTEKKLLRESMNNFNAVFADLKSEIQTHMLEFNSSLKTGIHNIGTEFDNLKAEIQLEMSTYNKTLSDALSISNATLEAKLEDMNEIVNNNSIMITTGIAKIESELNSTTHNVNQILLTINKSMLSHIEETETRIIAKFDKKQNDILKNVSSLRTDLGSLSSIVSSISSSISNRINSELLSLSSRISSVSSSLTSESSSLSSNISSISSSISSLSGRISAEEERKIAFHAQLRDADSYYIASKRIDFGDVFYNYGGGYDSSTGIFTATKSGTFLFIFNVESGIGGSAHIVLNIGGREISEARASQGYQNAGNSAVRYMRMGEKAWIETPDVNSRYYIYNYRTQFIGVLID